jgi:hypothetical protein
MLVNIIQDFFVEDRRWKVGDNPDVPKEVALRWIADGKATLDTDGRRNDGSAVPGDGIFHLVFHGQSNATAEDSYPVADTGADHQPGALKPRSGTDTWATATATTPAARAAWVLTDMQQDAGSGLSFTARKESPIVSAARALVWRDGGRVVGTCAGHGGRYLSELSAENSAPDARNAGARGPGGYWATMLDDLGRVNATGRALVWIQGEAEGNRKLYAWESARTTTAARDGYKTNFAQLVTDWRAAAPGAPVLVCQPASSNVITPAHPEMVNPAAGVYLVGPMYAYPNAINVSRPDGSARGDIAHHAPDGHRWHGEQIAKVLSRVRAGEAWQGMRCLSATRISSTQIDLSVTVPRPPMVVDTAWMQKRRFFGIAAYTGDPNTLGTENPVTAITVQDDGSATGVGVLRLTISPGIASGGFVRIGSGREYDATITDCTVASVAAGPTVAGQATTEVTITGDVSARFAGIVDRGSFWWLKKSGPGTGTQWTVDRVTVVSGNTVLSGETRHWVGGNQAVAGDSWRPADLALGCNVRDSDDAISRTAYRDSYGNKAGQRYPLWNWLALGDVSIT